jgi:C-terminal processing protease CtpA/Prc
MNKNSAGGLLSFLLVIQSNVAASAQLLQGGVTDQEQTSVVHFRGAPFPADAKLSSDDYRKLEFGITGFSSTKSGKYPVVNQIYKGCPAEEVGLKFGDVMLRANGREFRKTDEQGDFWRIMDGRAGTKVALTVRRGDSIITFHLKRMNIEDIPNARVREKFEKLLRKYGPPSFDGE